MPDKQPAKQRVIAYIDGFNLYFGMKEKGWERYLWLNVKELARNLLKDDQRLVKVKYFTSRVSSTRRDPQKHRRQNTYLEALQTVSNVETYYGHYLDKPVTCGRCGCQWMGHEEKMTDVNIAMHMILDAVDQRYDTALLISGDSDLGGPVSQLRQRFRKNRMVVAFPPARYSATLANYAHSSFIIGRKKLADSQFPDDVPKQDGFILKKPGTWS